MKSHYNQNNHVRCLSMIVHHIYYYASTMRKLLLHVKHFKEMCFKLLLNLPFSCGHNQRIEGGNILLIADSSLENGFDAF